MAAGLVAAVEAEAGEINHAKHMALAILVARALEQAEVVAIQAAEEEGVDVVPLEMAAAKLP